MIPRLACPVGAGITTNGAPLLPSRPCARGAADAARIVVIATPRDVRIVSARPIEPTARHGEPGSLPLSMRSATHSRLVSATAGRLRGGGTPAPACRQSVGQVRYTRVVPDQVAELLLTEAALEKLGARAISAEESGQLLRNAHVVVRNPRAPIPRSRRLLIGRTNGGRSLTLVIEQTVEPTTWLTITGWESTEIERKILPDD